MLVLTLFAVLAGAGTALSPCVVPVLPALLSAGGSGGRRRPLGVVLGLTVTFAVTIIGLAKVTGGVGLGSDPLRVVAVVVLVAFGVVIAVPALAARLEAPLARLSRLGPRSRGDGFASGLLVGGALGFVYTPCAGPILAAVISVGAASGSSVAIGLAFAAGSGVMLLVLALGGRRVMERVRAAGRGVGLQRALGLVMVLTAIAIATQLDVRLDQQIAQHIPDVSLTAALEKSHAVQTRLSDLHGKSRYAVAAPDGAKPAAAPDGAAASNGAASGGAASGGAASGGAASAATSTLPDLGPAPAFVDTQRWFNTPGGRPLTLVGLRGRVVLIDFWTYTCINCLRTLPYLEAWDARYRQAGLSIVGVHTPEFSFEHDAGNVSNAIGQLGIHYAVAQDNNMGTWNAWGNQYWPAEYLIDARGHVRDASFGEGEYAKTESAIRVLLAEAGHPASTATDANPIGAVTPSQQTTPETYLGSARAQGWVPAEPQDGTRRYAAPRVNLNEFAYGGTWTVTPEQATAGPAATIDAGVRAKNVYMVLSPPARGGSGRVQILVDGRLRATITPARQQLYTLASFAADGRHHLTLRFSPGVRGYSFTFG